MKITVSDNLITLAKKLQKFAPLYIVGGYVRNALIGIPSSDVDLCSKLTPEKLESILNGTKFEIREKSKKLGTVTIKCENETWEHTTFRRDNYNTTGEHRPKDVDFVEDIREDARRRDFTINAIYYDILKDDIIDIYSGLFDIQKRIIRCVETPSYVFHSDGLRILRMVRFAAELNFKIDRSTLAMAKKMAYRIKDIKGQRKYSELELILNSSERYKISKRNSFMRGLKLLNYLRIWPMLYVSSSVVKYRLCKKSAFSNRFKTLLIDIIDTVKPDCVDYYLAFILGNDGFMLGNTQISSHAKIICGYYDALNKMSNKKYFFKYYDQFSKISDILMLKSIFLYNKYNFFFNYIKKHKLPIHLKELNVNGNDLKQNFPEISPKKYSLVLISLLEKVFDGSVSNDKGELLKEVKNDIDDIMQSQPGN